MKKKKTYILLLLPALLISGSIVVLPGISTIYSSLTSWNGFSADKEFIGLENYFYLFHDRYFKIALKNNLTWTILFLTIPVVIAMAAALLLLKRKHGRTVLQMIFLIPYVLAPVVNAMIWKNIIYNPTSGLLNFINELGIFEGQLKNPLTVRGIGLFAVAAVDIWHFWSYLMIIYLAALRQTPQDQIESAKLDGANFRQQFRYVYYPCIKPTVKLMSIMIIIFSFLAYDYVQLLTQGGPAHYTEMLSTLAYSTAFSEQKIGRASAAAIIMSVFGLIASVIYMKVSKGEERE